MLTVVPGTPRGGSNSAQTGVSASETGATSHSAATTAAKPARTRNNATGGLILTGLSTFTRVRLRRRRSCHVCADNAPMTRRGEPAFIFEAQRAGVRARLTGNDRMQPETADRWLDAWVLEAATRALPRDGRTGPRLMTGSRPSGQQDDRAWD